MGRLTTAAMAGTMFFGVGIIIGSAVTGSSGSSVAGMAIGGLLVMATGLFAVYLTAHRWPDD